MTPLAKRMMIRRLILAVVLALAFGFMVLGNFIKENRIFSDVASENQVLRQVKILAFGDSLFAGYKLLPEESFPSQLEERLINEGYDVLVTNGGQNGDTTAQGLARLEAAIEDNPDIVIVEFGANDALRSLPPDAMYKNLDEMLNILEERGIIVLLVGLKYNGKLPIANVSSFQENYEKLAKRHNVLFYSDLMSGVLDKGDSSLLLEDRLHPSAKGVRVMVDGILPYVKQLLSSFKAE